MARPCGMASIPCLLCAVSAVAGEGCGAGRLGPTQLAVADRNFLPDEWRLAFQWRSGHSSPRLQRTSGGLCPDLCRPGRDRNPGKLCLFHLGKSCGRMVHQLLPFERLRSNFRSSSPGSAPRIHLRLNLYPHAAYRATCSLHRDSLWSSTRFSGDVHWGVDRFCSEWRDHEQERARCN